MALFVLSSWLYGRRLSITAFWRDRASADIVTSVLTNLQAILGEQHDNDRPSNNQYVMDDVLGTPETRVEHCTIL